MKTRGTQLVGQCRPSAFESDLALATASDAPVLITGRCEETCAQVAREIHNRRAERLHGKGAFIELTWPVRHPDELARLRLAARTQPSGDATSATAFLSLQRTALDEQAGLFDLLEALRGRMRPICAAQPVLLDDVDAGRFAPRLFYRLNVIHIEADENLRRREAGNAATVVSTGSEVEDAEAWMALIRSEFEEMPDLRLSFDDVVALWELSPGAANHCLGTLVSLGFLIQQSDGSYMHIGRVSGSLA